MVARRSPGEKPGREAQRKGRGGKSKVDAKPIAADATEHRLAELLDLPIRVRVLIGEREVPIPTLLDYDQGSLLELGVRAGDALRLEANGVLLGTGTAVTVEGRLALRLDEVRAPREVLPEFFSRGEASDEKPRRS